jgi:uncharacterized phage-associated protein
MKLQKLCYYAQGWWLAWTGAPLFPEDSQAWASGPICPTLYDLHKDVFVVKDGFLEPQIPKRNLQRIKSKRST